MRGHPLSFEILRLREGRGFEVEEGSFKWLPMAGLRSGVI
jgi:hypothetical protein